MSAPLNRTLLSATERNFRSRITQLSSGQWFLRGTLSERSGTCGKANCRCARGELHESLYLVQSQDGKPRQICVPKAWQQRVRQAVKPKLCTQFDLSGCAVSFGCHDLF